MSLSTRFRTYAFLGAFGCLTMVPGLWTLGSAPTSGLGLDVLSGSTQRHYEARFDDHMPLRRAMRQGWAAVKFGILGEVAEGAVLGRDGVLFTAEEFTSPAGGRDFSAALLVARDAVAASGAELIPIVVPDKARMMSDALPRARSAHLAARYDEMLDIITAAGLRTVDQRSALSTDNAFMRTDTHWSPKGARRAAQVIADLVADELPSDTAFQTTQTGREEFHGDLIAFADTGIWRPLTGPAPEHIETFETVSVGTQQLGLFDDVATPIVLVGTSFSARSDFHFVGFLKSALGADVLSFALEGQGPFLPMERFLNADHLAEITPQFVLWEIPERYIDTWSQHP